jgi:inward rectifier potassium channel
VGANRAGGAKRLTAPVRILSREGMKRKPPAPIRVRAGSFEFLKVNAAQWEWRDLYHWLLTLRWPAFAGFLLSVYLAINAIFATLYVLGGNCVQEMPPDSFWSAFFFSVETLATVGYGHMYPSTIYGHIVVTLEIWAGMFGTAVMTGLIFVRFARPMARVQFSRVMVLSRFDGQPALMIRVANERHTPMAEAEFRLMLIRHEPTLEDCSMHRFHKLPLQVDRLINFPAAVTMRHIIDECSPLYGATRESLERSNARFMVSIVCVDKVLHASVQSDKSYYWHEIRFDERFCEMYVDQEGGPTMVDYARLHETEAVDPKHCLGKFESGLSREIAKDFSA